MTSYFIGIDVSTTASKTLVIDTQGKVVACQTAAHPLSTPYPLWSEQNPQDWWSATCATLREVLKTIPAEHITAIGLTGQMHGLVTIDQHGYPLRPAILWNDQRSSEQCEKITRQLGADFITQHLGSILLPCFITPKLLWLKENEPEIYKKIAHILLPKDYIRFRLSGEYATDVADGSGLGLMDIKKRAWSDILISAADIPEHWLPSLHESQHICAWVNAAAAAETGLKIGTPIVAGAGDQPAQGIGSGIVEPGAASLAVGTSGVMFSVTDQYKPDPQGRLNTFCHAVPNQWFYMGVTMSAAGSMRWLRDMLAPNTYYAALDKQAALIRHGADGLLFAPYLSGERHPHSDPFARGAWVGLTLRHGLAHMTRAVMEGVAFSLRDLLELLHLLGIHPSDLMISGGAANSSLWKKIIAEVMGLPLYTVNSNEGAALGAAILAAVGVKAWPDVFSACNDLIKKHNSEIPQPEGIAAYQKLYPLYRKLYPSLREIFQQLSIYESETF